MELFKYMPYREEFFERWMLAFTPAVMFNDPFEGQMTKSSIVSTLYGAMQKRGTDSFINMTKEEIEKMYVPNSSYLLGILSLSRSKHSLLMWAHYADNHEGIILGVDSTNPFFNQTISPKVDHPSDISLGIDTSLLGKIFPVNYERVRFEMASKEHINGIPALLQKSDEWIYEKEYRMFMKITDGEIVADKDRKKLVSLFQIPGEAIIRIVMGVRSDKPKILNFFDKALKLNSKLSHIKIESAELNKDLYHIEHFPAQLESF